MNTDLAPTINNETVARVPAVTPDQHDLIRRTVAKDATDDELRLYLYDCARQGVHPLDKLIHFTKRGGKYTPITSIDLMRMRAADTGEYIGNDQYEFTGTPGKPDFMAVARVWRFVNGQRSAFTREARWSEYCPPPGQDHMWRRMPHVMLGKCAEGQALRAGFPRQLHGLYAAEELQQADGPIKTLTYEKDEAASAEPDRDPDPDLPAGFVRIRRVDSTPTKNASVIRHVLVLSTGETATTINSLKASLAQQFAEQGTPCLVETKTTKYGAELVSIKSATEVERQPEPPPPVEDQPF